MNKLIPILSVLIIFISGCATQLPGNQTINTTTPQLLSFVETGKQYDNVSETNRQFGISEVGGKLAYIAESGYESFIVFDGVEIKKPHDIISYPTDIGGKLAYLAFDYEEDEFFVVLDGVERKRYEPTGSILPPITALTDIGGKLAYYVLQPGTESAQEFIVFDGVETKKYPTGSPESAGRLSQPYNIGNKLAYIVQEYPTELKFVVFDGIDGKKYDSIAELIDLNGKPVYVVVTDTGYIIVSDRTEMPQDKYIHVGELTVIDGKLAYIAEHPDLTYQIVYDSKEIDARYEMITDIVDVSGKLAYLVEQDKKQFVVFDGVEGKKYDGTISIFDGGVNGKPIYVVEEQGNESLVVSGTPGFIEEKKHKEFVVVGDKESKKYDRIKQLIVVNSEAAYSVQDGDKNFIIYKNQEIGKQYDDVFALASVGGKLAFIAEKDEKKFIVMEK